MARPRLQFRLIHLIAAMALLAAWLASATYLPATFRIHGRVAGTVVALSVILAWVLGGVALCSRRSRVPAMAALLAVNGLFCFSQARLMQRLRHLEAEVQCIITFVEKHRKGHEGECPTNLSLYAFNRPELKPFIRYTPPAQYDPRTELGDSPYAVHYHPIQRTKVWHVATGGYWYDDD